VPGRLRSHKPGASDATAAPGAGQKTPSSRQDVDRATSEQDSASAADEQEDSQSSAASANESLVGIHSHKQLCFTIMYRVSPPQKKKIT